MMKNSLLLLLALCLCSCSTLTFQGDYQIVLSKSSGTGLSRWLGITAEYCKMTKKGATPITQSEVDLFAQYCPGEVDMLSFLTAQLQQQQQTP